MLEFNPTHWIFHVIRRISESSDILRLELLADITLTEASFASLDDLLLEKVTPTEIVISPFTDFNDYAAGYPRSRETLKADVG